MGIVRISNGIGPVNRFCFRDRLPRMGSLSRLAGICPVKPWLLRSRFWKATRSPKNSGMGQSKGLFLILKYSSFVLTDWGISNPV